MANCANIFSPADFGGSMTCAQLTTTLEELKIICAELNALTLGSPPNIFEQLLVSASSIAVTGIHTASVVQYFRNGVLQSSNMYSITTDTITPTTIGGGDYSEDNINVYWW